MTVSFKSNADDLWHQLCYLGYRTVSGRVSALLILSLPLLETACFASLTPPHSHFRHFLFHNLWPSISFLYVFVASVFAFAVLVGSLIMPRHTITISKEECHFQNIFSVKSPWRHFLRLADEGDYFYFIGWRRTIYIPKRAFQSPAEADAFFERAVKYWHEAKGLPIPVPNAPDLSGVWPPAPLPGKSAELDENRKR